MSKKNIKLGIRARFIILVGGLLTMVFTVLAVYLSQTNSLLLKQNLKDETKAFATLATPPIGDVFSIYKDSGKVNIDAKISSFLVLSKSVSNVTIVSNDGKQLYKRFDNVQESISVDDASSFEPVYRYDRNGLINRIVYPYTASNGARTVSLVYYISNKEAEKTVRQSVISIIFLSAVSLFSTLGVLYFFVNYWLIRKIRKLSKQTAAISSGQLDTEVKIESSDELGEMATSVQIMAESLKKDIEKLKEVDKVKSEFMTITSHNLRTPLTIINGYIETSEDLTTVDELKQALKQISAGAHRLNSFAEDVMTISHLELTSDVGKLEDVYSTEFLTAIAVDVKQLAVLKKITFSYDLETIEQKIQINRPYFRTAVWNLLDNAIKFTPEGGSIELTLINKGDRIEIGVRDTGIGISPDEITKLFTKFHRGTSVLTYNFEGTGIGLYATKMIVERHGGEVHVSSEQGAGSYFTLLIPFKQTLETTTIST